jgi:hypothetical protein
MSLVDVVLIDGDDLESIRRRRIVELQQRAAKMAVSIILQSTLFLFLLLLLLLLLLPFPFATSFILIARSKMIMVM